MALDSTGNLRAEAEYYDFPVPKDKSGSFDVGLEVLDVEDLDPPPPPPPPEWGDYRPEHEYYRFVRGETLEGERIRSGFRDFGVYTELQWVRGPITPDMVFVAELSGEPVEASMGPASDNAGYAEIGTKEGRYDGAGFNGSGV